VRDKVTIAYRGEKYEIGRGATFFGIWAAGAPRSQPLEWWPDTPEGWAAAWSRFTSIETPGTIVSAGGRTTPVGGRPLPASQDAGSAEQDAAGSGEGPAWVGQGGVPLGPRHAGAGVGGYIAAGLLAAGVVLGVVGLFPGYLDGVSLARRPADLTPHVIYLAAWAASAALIALGGTRLRLGALLGSGLSLVTFGLFFADAGTAMAGGLHLADAGLVLSIAGWLACAAGSAVAMLVPSPGRSGQPPRAVRHPGPRGRLGGAHVGRAVLLVVAGLGAAIAFAPSWDSFTLRTSFGLSQSLTAGNAFDNPGPVIAGDVAVMVALAAVIIAAALWRPVRHGAVLLAGATVPMIAQAISALVQAGESATPEQFGFSPTQAQRLGLTISSGLTPTFWIYCAFVLALVVSCAWMLFTPLEPTGVSAGPYPSVPPDDDAGAWTVPPAAAFDLADGPSADLADGPSADLADGPSAGPADDETETTPEPVTLPPLATG